ncbi:MAG: type IV secretion system DNA-binding domain-containing protein [Dehalococcoidia bacterium]|nr:type IV secretion system DNA-binding domain-containing protein [Dehalococcoidia bacterium]
MNPFSLLSGLFGSRRMSEPVILAITPPRSGERTLLGVENMLQSIAFPEPFSLELVGDEDGVRLLARCQDSRSVAAQIAAHYPQARVGRLDPDEDPLLVRDDQEAWTMSLRSGGPPHASLQQFSEDVLSDEGSDPMLATIGALSPLRRGERAVSRLLLRSLGPQWAAPYELQLERQSATAQRPTQQESQVNHGEIVRLMVLGIAALVGFRTWQYWQDGDVLKAIGLAGGAVLAALTAAILWAKIRGGKGNLRDSQSAREKLSRMAFEAELRITAVVDAREGRSRGEELLRKTAAAYRHYDNPSGARFVGHKIRPEPDTVALAPTSPGLFGRHSVLGVREVAALWHPPATRDETPPIERSGSRVLPPARRELAIGAHVGDATSDPPGRVRFPDDLLRRHHLYVARTRMGKSTLMQHIVAHKMEQKALGRDDDAIVVIDPHADLVSSLLAHVPHDLVDAVRLIDLADHNGAPGVNLLDTRVFTDRDRTADSVVRIARGLWDQWGPRMQSIIEHVVKTLHEANRKREANRQYTILDALRLLAPNDASFREKVLRQIDDRFIRRWWERDFTGWNRQYQADAVAPVQTRLSYYASSERTRAILGQSRSTVDIRQTIRDGGILLVSTAQGAAGREVAAHVGSSMRNLVDAVIREQGYFPPEERRGVLVVVDEMQSMPGVDYDAMLSELGKFGASFILATQSLAKLDDLSPVLRHSILANVGCLAVFQVASGDARLLVDELGSSRVSIDDITGLSVHHCYVRATVGTARLPAFSMEVRKPERGDMDVAWRIREGTVDYTTSLSTIQIRDAILDGPAGELPKSADGAMTNGTPPVGDVSPDASTVGTNTGNDVPHRRRKNGHIGDAHRARDGETSTKETP